MSDWWKAPVLQGPENDYGDYDYLINPLPEDKYEIRITRYPVRCDCCGRDTHIYRYSSYHFYTYDGYDSMDEYECMLCEKGVTRKMRQLKKKFKSFLK